MKTQSQKQALAWGGLLIFFGVVSLAESFIGLSVWAWIVSLAVAGCGVFGIYLTDRSEWTLLIPAYVMWAVSGLVALITVNILQGGAIATYVLSAIAVPFAVVFVRDREKWWALIPAYVLLAVGVMVGLIDLGILDDLLIPAYVMLAIAIPFFVVYTRDAKQWWSLIPGGIMAVIGLAFLIAEVAVQYIGAIALVIAGVWILVRPFGRGE